MQELSIQEIEEVAGGNIFYDAGYYVAKFIQWSRMPQDEYVWVA